MPWINMDIVTKTATVHVDTCGYMGTQSKREGAGSWRRSDTVEDAVKDARIPDNYAVKKCGHCFRN